MSDKGKLRVRRSLEDLQAAYDKGDKKPLENLWRAWKGIKELPADDPNSFFMIGGYHGEPFRGAGWGNSAWWGGYCNHGNVLFPTWHRVYMLRLEDALRSVHGCGDVTMAYWDECSDASTSGGLPKALTDEFVTLDGQSIPNPIRSFVFTKQITDNINGDDPNYSKPLGYETVRYPLSGLVGTPADQAATKAHNAKYPDYAANVGILNGNIVNWLTSSITVDGQVIPTNEKAAYQACLDAPNYTAFSNTTSAAQWNEDNPNGVVTPVESPHNAIHLACGGYDVATGANAGDDSPVEGANGDMGENDTAGLDPLFYFHHCFIDRMFWLWQQKNGHTDHLDIIEGYPGTNSVDNQGPTPGVAGGTWLGMDSLLAPFKKADGKTYTSRDCVNIEKQLGVTYGPGSLEPGARLDALSVKPPPAKILAVSAINRGAIRGSFLINAYVNHDGKRLRIGTEAVLSRWTVAGCANCQTHLEVKAHFALPQALAEGAPPNYEIELRTHDGPMSHTHVAALGTVSGTKQLFRLQVRDVYAPAQAAE
ncbi:MAG TPA: tyrosinase family protein [Caulobacteraceae bacterium]|jgi:tyrosinase